MKASLYTQLVGGDFPVYVDEEGDNHLTTDDMYGYPYWDGKRIDAVRVRIDVRTDDSEWHEIRSDEQRDISDAVKSDIRKQAKEIERHAEFMAKHAIESERQKRHDNEDIDKSFWFKGTCFNGVESLLRNLRSSQDQVSITWTTHKTGWFGRRWDVTVSGKRKHIATLLKRIKDYEND